MDGSGWVRLFDDRGLPQVLDRRVEVSQDGVVDFIHVQPTILRGVDASHFWGTDHLFVIGLEEKTQVGEQSRVRGTREVGRGNVFVEFEDGGLFNIQELTNTSGFVPCWQGKGIRVRKNLSGTEGTIENGDCGDVYPEERLEVIEKVVDVGRWWPGFHVTGSFHQECERGVHEGVCCERGKSEGILKGDVIE